MPDAITLLFTLRLSNIFHRLLHAIREGGATAGVVLNPGTPVEAALEVLPDVDLVLIMSVNPGFGGQSFIPTVESKIRTLRKAIDEQVASGGRDVQLQIDGGVKAHNIAMLRDWGVTNAVVGSACSTPTLALQTT